MKVLLDENLDRRLRNHLGSHEVFTVSYKGWDGLKNGALLSAAEDQGFEVLVPGGSDPLARAESGWQKARRCVSFLRRVAHS